MCVEGYCASVARGLQPREGAAGVGLVGIPFCRTVYNPSALSSWDPLKQPARRLLLAVGLQQHRMGKCCDCHCALRGSPWEPAPS